MAYTSECFPCRPGWFSSAPGSSSCQPCPSGTFSAKGASSCTPCPAHHYSRTTQRPSYLSLPPRVCLSMPVRGVEAHPLLLFPSAQTKAGQSAKSSRRARTGISSRSTRPATPRGRSVPASSSCQKSINMDTRTLCDCCDINVENWIYIAYTEGI